MTTPLKTQCCPECLIHLPYKTKNEFQCGNGECPCHQKSVGEDDHKYAVEVKLLDRFYDLYEAGKKEGAPQNYISYFEARTYLLTEVEKALAKRERAVIKKEITKQTLINDGDDTFVKLGEALWVCDSEEARAKFIKSLNNQPEV